MLISFMLIKKKIVSKTRFATVLASTRIQDFIWSVPSKHLPTLEKGVKYVIIRTTE